MVERYEFTCPDCDPYVVAVNLGRYVRYSDYASLRKELAERTAERDRAQHHTSELLARIHRDGGHYEIEHGTTKAVMVADAIIARMYADPAEARADTLARRVEGLEADNERLTKERDRERKHVARLMRDLQHNRERAEKAEAIIRAAPLIQTALTHASFALDGIVALDDEDMGKDGGSATCQQAKHTVDRALAALKQKDGGNG